MTNCKMSFFSIYALFPTFRLFYYNFACISRGTPIHTTREIVSIRQWFRELFQMKDKNAEALHSAVLFAAFFFSLSYIQMFEDIF